MRIIYVLSNLITFENLFFNIALDITAFQKTLFNGLSSWNMAIIKSFLNISRRNIIVNCYQVVSFCCGFHCKDLALLTPILSNSSQGRQIFMRCIIKGVTLIKLDGMAYVAINAKSKSCKIVLILFNIDLKNLTSSV